MCCLLFNIKYLFMCYFYNLSKYFKNLEINPNLVSNHLLKSIWDHFSTFLMLTGHIKLHLDKCSKWNIWIITFLCFDKCSFTYVRQRITSWKINELWHIKSIFFPLIFFICFFGLDFEIQENVIMNSKYNYVFLEKGRHYLIAQMALVW